MTYEGVDIQTYIFLSWALIGGGWLDSRPARLIRRERIPGTHWISDWISPRADLDVNNESS
jgi:hypothetical protein